ncbi:MAG: hypothetical protein QGG54_08295 [Gammaproteobacteria bacterium]|nr:hypothetical protein [Gammaproteobacteria bacterium]MDP6654145.1 hypothetical protein [Gammaproteobacteria bacterium]
MNPEALFRPFDHPKLQLKNRIAMAPMTRRFSPDSIPDDKVRDYCRIRAEGDVGGGELKNIMKYRWCINTAPEEASWLSSCCHARIGMNNQSNDISITTGESLQRFINVRQRVSRRN